MIFFPFSGRGFRLSMTSNSSCDHVNSWEEDYKTLRMTLVCVIYFKHKTLLTSIDYHQVIRHGTSHQAGSDSLLTSQTFFKLREVYFNDQIDDNECSGKLYGLGQTFSVINGLTDPSRGGATIAERDDRGSIRDLHNQTPGSIGGPQQASMTMTSLQALSAMSPGAYTNHMSQNGPFLRQSLVGGRWPFLILLLDYIWCIIYSCVVFYYLRWRDHELLKHRGSWVWTCMTGEKWQTKATVPTATNLRWFCNWSRQNVHRRLIKSGAQKNTLPKQSCDSAVEGRDVEVC